MSEHNLTRYLFLRYVFAAIASFYLIAFTILGCAYSPKITSIVPLKKKGDLKELERIAFSYYKGEIPTRKAAEEAACRMIKNILSEKKIGDLRLTYRKWSPTPPWEIPSFASSIPSWTVDASSPMYAAIKQSIQEAGLWTDDSSGLILTIIVTETTADPRVLNPPPNITVPPGTLLGYLACLGTKYEFSLNVAGYNTQSPGECFLPKEVIEKIKSILK